MTLDSSFLLSHVNFNSHPHKEDDVSLAVLISFFRDFNSHPHKEDDYYRQRTLRSRSISTHILTRRMTRLMRKTLHYWKFQLTSSQGGWRDFCNQLYSSEYFNSHPHKEDDNTFGRQSANDDDFNSHPHKDDISLCGTFLRMYISTHILTRRMTYVPVANRADIDISTHILTRRMTFRAGRGTEGNRFQLTSSQGGWPDAAKKEWRRIAFQLTSSQGGWPRFGTR